MIESPSNRGIVYILSNPAMPNYIKLGQTAGDSEDDVKRRMKELAQPTGVPRAFDCEYAAVVDDYQHIEQQILYALDHFRVNPKREFLEGLDPIRVKAILKLHELKEVTPGADAASPEDPDDEERPPKRRERFTFSMVGIPVGAILHWADDSAVTCEVLDEKTTVQYEGENYTISPLAQKLKRWKRMPSGTPYWVYEGETLQERRDRLEQEAELAGE